MRSPARFGFLNVRGHDGAFAFGGFSLATTKVARMTDAQRCATVIKEAIATLWNGSKKELYESADISDTAMYGLINDGAETETPSLKALCRALRIDPAEALEGNLVRVSPSPEILSMVQDLLATELQESLAVQIRALHKAKFSGNR